MRHTLSILLLGSAVVVGSRAYAEPMMGSRGELLGYVQAYAGCTVRYSHKRAQELVLSNVADDQMESDFKDIYVSSPLVWVSGCRELVIRDGVAFRLQPGMYRAALAESLIATDLKDAPIADLSLRAPLQHWQPESEASLGQRLAAASSDRLRANIETKHNAEISKIWLAAYGECVVRKDSIGSWGWAMSKSGSRDEVVAIARLKTALGDCLTSGRTLNFPKDVLRGTVAINYYRLAKAPAAVAIGVGS
ncbi:MAG: hypothetical protein ABL912_10895 [Novosphingobium sp.]